MARKILLVEDDPHLRAQMTTLLEDEGYSVMAANNGADALLILWHQDPPDLVLLDLMMPLMSGWELSQQLSADPRLAKMPLLILSGMADAREAALLRVPPQNFLRKPFQTEDLLAAVRRTIA
jgi:CheY-like chemotaxis protein